MQRITLLKKKSIQNWSWIFLLSYFLLSKLHVSFGILGFVCMISPFIFAVKYKGKVHCSHYCPRGSFFGKFLSKISLQNNLFNWMRTTTFKNILLGAMVLSFASSLYGGWGTFSGIANAMTLMMFRSLLLGIFMGIVYKPRAWCQVCPMKTGSKHFKHTVNKSRIAMNLEANCV
ncbi:MAG: hypothetical protein KAH04_06815 [Psychrilyobacter sp.]|nr:hypothetical protein [Psychrilyobacter sp.]